MRLEAGPSIAARPSASPRGFSSTIPRSPGLSPIPTKPFNIYQSRPSVPAVNLNKISSSPISKSEQALTTRFGPRVENTTPRSKSIAPIRFLSADQINSISPSPAAPLPTPEVRIYTPNQTRELLAPSSPKVESILAAPIYQPKLIPNLDQVGTNKSLSEIIRQTQPDTIRDNRTRPTLPTPGSPIKRLTPVEIAQITRKAKAPIISSPQIKNSPENINQPNNKTLTQAELKTILRNPTNQLIAKKIEAIASPINLVKSKSVQSTPPKDTLNQANLLLSETNLQTSIKNIVQARQILANQSQPINRPDTINPKKPTDAINQNPSLRKTDQLITELITASPNKVFVEQSVNSTHHTPALITPELIQQVETKLINQATEKITHLRQTLTYPETTADLKQAIITSQALEKAGISPTIANSTVTQSLKSELLKQAYQQYVLTKSETNPQTEDLAEKAILMTIIKVMVTEKRYKKLVRLIHQRDETTNHNRVEYLRQIIEQSAQPEPESADQSPKISGSLIAQQVPQHRPAELISKMLLPLPDTHDGSLEASLQEIATTQYDTPEQAIQHISHLPDRHTAVEIKEEVTTVEASHSEIEKVIMGKISRQDLAGIIALMLSEIGYQPSLAKDAIQMIPVNNIPLETNSIDQ